MASEDGIHDVRDRVMRRPMAYTAQLDFEQLFPAGWRDDEHLRDTPQRFWNMMFELTAKPDIKWKDFESDSDEMVVVRDITFHSLCAHHMLPYIGRAHVGYIPNGRVCGLSKLARIVGHCAAGLTVQEDLTTNIASVIELCFMHGGIDAPLPRPQSSKGPIGVAVVLEAEHLCMTLRGVQTPGAMTVTSCMRGAFSDHDRLARAEFLNFIRPGGASA